MKKIFYTFLLACLPITVFGQSTYTVHPISLSQNNASVKMAIIQIDSVYPVIYIGGVASPSGTAMTVAPQPHGNVLIFQQNTGADTAVLTYIEITGGIKDTVAISKIDPEALNAGYGFDSVVSATLKGASDDSVTISYGGPYIRLGATYSSPPMVLGAINSSSGASCVTPNTAGVWFGPKLFNNVAYFNITSWYGPMRVISF